MHSEPLYFLAQNTTYSLVMYTVLRNCPVMMDQLLALGAPAHWRNNRGTNAMQMCAKLGHEHLAQLLWQRVKHGITQEEMEREAPERVARGIGPKG